MNFSNFDLNLLRAFDVLMHEKNVSRAAVRMSLSQPAMSNALSRLRHLMDDPLLVRTRQGMQPTPKALALEKPVRMALNAIEHALEPGPDFDPATAEQTFHIATTDYIELLFLPGFQRHLDQIAPGIRLETHALEGDVPEARLEEGIYDFAIGRFPDIPARLSKDLWLSDHLVCLTCEDHPYLGDSMTLDEFLNARHIWVSVGQRTGLVDKWLKENNLRRNVALTVANYLMAPIMVAQSDMVLVTPSEVARHFMHSLNLRAVALPMDLGSFDIHSVSHPFHASTPAHKWFRQQLLMPEIWSAN